MARNSSVNFNSSAPSYPLETEGQNGAGPRQIVKNGRLRPRPCPDRRAGRNRGALDGRDFKENVPISCQPLRLFPACRSAGPGHGRGWREMWFVNFAPAAARCVRWQGSLAAKKAEEQQRAHLRVAAQLSAKTRPWPSMEGAGRGLAVACLHGWNGGVWHRFITGRRKRGIPEGRPVEV